MRAKDGDAHSMDVVDTEIVVASGREAEVGNTFVEGSMVSRTLAVHVDRSAENELTRAS